MNDLFKNYCQFAITHVQILLLAKSYINSKMVKGQETMFPIDQSQQFENKYESNLKCSHYWLVGACIFLILVSFSTNQTIMLTTQSKVGFSDGSNNLNNYILALTIILVIFAVFGIVSSYYRNSLCLQIFEIGCLLFFVLFVCILIGISYIKLQHTQNISNASISSSQALAKCYSPNNYFQYQIIQTISKANSLFCSLQCPCPQYSRVQQCPTWEKTTLDEVIAQMEQQFSCSGWCQVNKKSPFIFSGQKSITPAGVCHNKWAEWVTKRWIAINGILFLLTLLLVFNVVVAYIRTGQLMKYD